MAQQRSITPTTLKGFVPIIVEEANKLLKGFIGQRKSALAFGSKKLYDQIQKMSIEVFAVTYYEPDLYADDISNLEQLYTDNIKLIGQVMHEFLNFKS